MRPDYKVGIGLGALVAIILTVYFWPEAKPPAEPPAEPPGDREPVADTGEPSGQPPGPDRPTTPPAPPDRRRAWRWRDGQWEALPEEPPTPPPADVPPTRPVEPPPVEEPPADEEPGTTLLPPVAPPVVPLSPPVTPSPTPRPTRTHTVQPGDSFAAIAERYYDTQDRRAVKLLTDANPGVDPLRMKIGSEITVPPMPAGLLDAPAGESVQPLPSGSYRVKKGQSFWTIAQEVYGDVTLHERLYALNKDLVGGDPTNLRAGQVIRLLPDRPTPRVAPPPARTTPKVDATK